MALDFRHGLCFRKNNTTYFIASATAQPSNGIAVQTSAGTRYILGNVNSASDTIPFVKNGTTYYARQRVDYLDLTWQMSDVSGGHGSIGVLNARASLTIGFVENLTITLYYNNTGTWLEGNGLTVTANSTTAGPSGTLVAGTLNYQYKFVAKMGNKTWESSVFTRNDGTRSCSITLSVSAPITG